MIDDEDPVIYDDILTGDMWDQISTWEEVWVKTYKETFYTIVQWCIDNVGILNFSCDGCIINENGWKKIFELSQRSFYVLPPSIQIADHRDLIYSSNTTFRFRNLDDLIMFKLIWR